MNIEINNNAGYGYDVRGELVCLEGSIMLKSPVHSMVNSKLCSSSEYESDWRGRYFEAYRKQNIAFLDFVRTCVFPVIASNSWDGYAAAIVAEAGVEALRRAQKVDIKMIGKSKFYN